MNRFDAFADQEKAYLALGLTLVTADMMLGVVTGAPAPPSALLAFANHGLPLYDEMAATFDLPSLDPALMAALREKLAAEIVEEGSGT